MQKFIGLWVIDREKLPKVPCPLGILMPCGTAVLYWNWWEIPQITTRCPCGDWRQIVVAYGEDGMPDPEAPEPYEDQWPVPDGDEENCEPCGGGPCFCADVGRPCELCGVTQPEPRTL